MKRAMCFATASVLTLSASITGAAETSDASYPNRPIRFVIPFVPGGPSDIMSRLLGGKLHEAVGHSVVIDNRGSAGGIVGFEIGAKAPPDGYTITMAAYSGLVINQFTYLKLPYDPMRDFQPVTQLTRGPAVLVIHPSVPAKTLQEFVALAKAKPAQLNYATTGTGNLISTEMIKSAAGINVVPIPYKGTGQAVIDLLSGQVQMMVMSPLVAVPNIKAGKLRALGVTSLERSSILPDVPTIAEAGFPGYQNVGWHSIVMPAKTPAPFVKRMHSEFAKILQQAEVKEKIQAQGLEVVGSTPEALADLIVKDAAKYQKIVKEIGLKPQ